MLVFRREGRLTMGFYDKHILPPLLGAMMGTKPIRYQRKKVVPHAGDRVWGGT
jgi:hypothetical protein